MTVTITEKDILSVAVSYWDEAEDWQDQWDHIFWKLAGWLDLIGHQNYELRILLNDLSHQAICREYLCIEEGRHSNPMAVRQVPS